MRNREIIEIYSKLVENFEEIIELQAQIIEQLRIDKLLKECEDEPSLK